MPQRPAKRGKGDAGIAAGGLGQRIALVQQPCGVGSAQHLECHAVLGGTGKVQVLGFRIDRVLTPTKAVADGKKRRVADRLAQPREPAQRPPCPLRRSTRNRWCSYGAGDRGHRFSLKAGSGFAQIRLELLSGLCLTIAGENDI